MRSYGWHAELEHVKVKCSATCVVWVRSVASAAQSFDGEASTLDSDSGDAGLSCASARAPGRRWHTRSDCFGRASGANCRAGRRMARRPTTTGGSQWAS